MLKVRWNFLLLSLYIIYSLCIFSTNALLSGDDLLVNAGNLGTIQGVPRQTVETKRDYVDFLGIPYAQSPEGQSRFLPPEPINPPLAPVGEIFKANVKMPCCPQANNLLCAFRQGENCLGLHISTPQIEGKTKKLFPVIVFIHGGAFTLGSSDTYNGARLLERDVVLVTVNYRLGLLGFFCLNTASVPGNAAMYDLFQSLVFIKEYIEYFGGDPNSITLAGQSAGSVAVTHLMLSPLTRDKGLFHRAISLSGTALNEWGTTTAEIAEQASLTLATRVGCNDPGKEKDADAIAACMRTVPHKTLVDKLEEYQREERKQGRLGFAPVTPIVQTTGAGGGVKFLDEAPEIILEQKKQSDIPLIMGSTRHDGSFVLSMVFNQFLKLEGLQNNSTFLKTQMVPMLLKALGIEDKTEAVYETLANVYLGKDIKLSGNFSLMIPGLMDLHSIFFFKAAAYRTIKLHSRLQSNSYWYAFDFKGTKSVYSTLVNTTGNPVPGGVTHGDDLIYLFSIPLMTLTQPDEKAVSERLVNYWANFAWTGNPNLREDEDANTVKEGGEWPAFSEANPFYASLNKEDEMVEDFPMDGWKGVSHELLPELFPPEEPSTPKVDETTVQDESTSTTVKDESTSTTVKDESTSTTVKDESTSPVCSCSPNPTTVTEEETESSTAAGDVESTTADGRAKTIVLSLPLITITLLCVWTVRL